MAFISVGQFLVAIGVVREDMGLMLLGRVMFGIGGESLCVAVSVLLQQVFAGAEVGLAMGLNLSVSRLGSVVNNVVSPYLARATGSVVPALMFGGGLCIMSLLATFVLVPLSGRLGRGGGFGSDSDERPPAVSELDSDGDGGGAGSGSGFSADTSLARRNAKSAWCFCFGGRFYLLVASCVVVYGTVLPFNNVASALLIEKFVCHGACCDSPILLGGAGNGSTQAHQQQQQCPAAVAAESQASYVMGIPFLVSAFFTPFVGLFADRFGGAGTMTLAAPVVLCGVHAALLVMVSMPIIPLVAQGIAYSMYAAALWPLLGRAVPAADAGTAYGLATAVQNIGLATIPVIVASLRTTAGDYDGVEYLFLGFSLTGAVLGVWLLVVDGSFYSFALNRPLGEQMTTAADGGANGVGNALRDEGGRLEAEDLERRQRDKALMYGSVPSDDGYDSGLLREEAKGLLEAEGGAVSGNESDRSFGLIN